MRRIPNFPIFFQVFHSRLTQAVKAQARLCIGLGSTEPSLLENAITVHCEIFQIKHWNINRRVIRTYFLKEVVTGNTQSEHLFRACTDCPATKIKILNHGPECQTVSVGSDLGPNC